MRNLTILILCLFFTACNDNDGKGGGEPIIISECAGFLIFTLDTSDNVPSNLKIIWSNEREPEEAELLVACAPESGKCVTQESSFPTGLLTRIENGVLVIDDGGFGYTAPKNVTLKVYDLGRDRDMEAPLLELEDYQVKEEAPEICETIRVDL